MNNEDNTNIMTMRTWIYNEAMIYVFHPVIALVQYISSSIILLTEQLRVQPIGGTVLNDFFRSSV